VGPATQAGFTPAAGGHLVKPSPQESDVELNAGPQVPVSNASYRVPRTSAALLLALGALVAPALLLAWGARPSRRRARRRA
jgi:hypothetical protein